MSAAGSPLVYCNTMRRKKSPSRPSFQHRSLRRLSRRIFIPILLLCIISAIVWGIWYSAQDQKARENARLQIIDTLEMLRDLNATPDMVDCWIEWGIDHIPAPRGIPISAEYIHAASDSHVIAGYPRSNSRASTQRRVLENIGYAVSYDEVMKNPSWSAYRLSYNPQGHSGKRPEAFKPDQRTRANIQHEDYTGSGFDRGHMAPNYGIAITYGRKAQLETFLMSNIVPQNPDFNRGIWRLLEQKIARRWTRRFSDVWVITGPIYREPVHRLPAGIAIPHAFFKIAAEISNHNELRVIAFIIPQHAQENDDMRRYLVTVDEVETLTGLDFFHLLDDSIEAPLESSRRERLW